MNRQAFVAAVVLTTSAAAASAQPGGANKIAVTSRSPEARALYLEGRDLGEKLRTTDALRKYEQAVAKDPSLALAWLGIAQTAASQRQVFDATAKAVALAEKVSEGERLLILAADATAKGNTQAQHDALTKLLRAFPNDERAHNQLGTFLFFVLQDFPASIESLNKSIALNPQYSQPYNLLGYAHRALGRYAEAEQAFKKYIALIPNDPNPYDSYAELLMKMGRHDDSMRNYRKALTVDPNFIASYIGIGNNQIFMGRGDEARASFAKLAAVSRNDGERRQATLWTAMSWVHEGQPHRALAELETMYAMAEVNGDAPSMAQDLNLIGAVLLEAGRPDEALGRFVDAVKVMDGAGVPAEVKEQARRNAVYNQARVALAKRDLTGARAKAAEYARQVAVHKNPVEVRLHHELSGRIALAEKSWAGAIEELQQASRQDPQVLFLEAQALEGKGETAKAREAYGRVARFNELVPSLAYVRAKAKAAAPSHP